MTIADPTRPIDVSMRLPVVRKRMRHDRPIPLDRRDNWSISIPCDSRFCLAHLPFLFCLHASISNNNVEPFVTEKATGWMKNRYAYEDRRLERRDERCVVSIGDGVGSL